MSTTYRLSWTWQEYVRGPGSRHPLLHTFARIQAPDDHLVGPLSVESLQRLAQAGCRSVIHDRGEEVALNVLASIEKREEYDSGHASAWQEVASLDKDGEVSPFLNEGDGTTAVLGARQYLADVLAGVVKPGAELAAPSGP